MVPGITELDVHDENEATFVYPTGEIWCLAEVLQLIRPMRPFGARAGLELCYLGAIILDQAAALGENHGINSHGNIDPWRVVLEADGDVQILGYGLPQMELLEGTALEPVADSYRYAPPERMKGEYEDVSSDIFSLALLGLELSTGEVVYDGDLQRAKHAAERATGAHQLHQWRDVLTDDVRKVFARALGLYRDERYDDPEDFARELKWLLEAPVAGATLTELMAYVTSHWKRDTPLPSSAKHLDYPPAEEDLRWSNVQRTQAAPEKRRDRPGRRERHADPKNRDGALPNSRRRLRERRPRQAQPDNNTMYPRQGITGDTERYLITLEGEEPHYVKLGVDESLAMSTARLVDKLAATPIDMSGELLGWYRLVQGGDAWFGDVKTRALDPSEEADLEFVENNLVTATFILMRDDEEVERDEILVGTAVHVQFLLSRLADRFELRERNWALWIDDKPLDRWQILDDFELENGAEIVLKRQRRRRR